MQNQNQDNAPHGAHPIVYCAKCGAANHTTALRCEQCDTPLKSEATFEAAAAEVERKVGFPVVSLIFAVISFIYLLNPTLGVLELIPDNFPVIGNLDEAAALMVLLRSMYNLGWLNEALDTILRAGMTNRQGQP